LGGSETLKKLTMRTKESIQAATKQAEDVVKLSTERIGTITKKVSATYYQCAVRFL
jgi:hypothetical protein